MSASRCVAAGLLIAGTVAGPIAQAPAQTQTTSIRTSTATYDHYLTGSAGDAASATRGGLLLAGGGTDVPDAFRWLIAQAGGGDVVILRASGADGYHDFITRLGRVDSIESFVFKSREASADPSVLRALERADAIFLAGGDQSNYVRYWKGTPVEAAINRSAARGVPVGGTSAGLAVLGELGYSALNRSITSAAALANPFSEDITIEREFLRLPHMGGLITDSHFVERDRLGRTLVFLARIAGARWATPARAIAIDRETAVLVDASGAATVVGNGPAFFIRATTTPAVLEANTPLTMLGIEVYRTTAGASFDLQAWTGAGGQAYTLSVDRGVVSSSTGHPYGVAVSR